MTFRSRTLAVRASVGALMSAIAAVSATVGVSVFAGQAAAQDRSFWGRPGNTQAAPPHTDEASRLYAEARADIDAGQIAAAQRRLEVLVARYPSSPLADVARRDLQRVYAGTFGVPNAAARTFDGPGLGSGPSPGPTPGPSPGPSPSSSPAPSPATSPSGIAPAALQTPAATHPRGASETLAVREASDEFRHLAGDRIFFPDSSIDLGGRAKAALEAQAAWLSRYPGIEVVIEGHSDDHGSRDYNRALSEKRAQAVKLRLNDLGIPADRIAVVAFGREQPLADCPEASCTAQNRRVVTVIARVPANVRFDLTRAPDQSRRDEQARLEQARQDLGKPDPTRDQPVRGPRAPSVPTR